MIRVAPADEPATFDARVRVRGLRAIAEMAGEKPNPKRTAGKPCGKRADRREDISPEYFPTYWTAALGDLMGAYNRICAYSCFRIHEITGAGSVDHFAPKSRAWDRVYEWDNYRLACSQLNARKRDFTDVLDPFEIQDGWFHLELVGFQVVPNPKLTRATREQVQQTISRLGLNDFRKSRASDAENYWNRDVSLRVLRTESPFVAMELERQNRLNPEDTPQPK
ncbi:MAG: hypothetical protein ACRC7O_04055 [Fimbriiglobus sp.]